MLGITHSCLNYLYIKNTYFLWIKKDLFHIKSHISKKNYSYNEIKNKHIDAVISAWVLEVLTSYAQGLEEIKLKREFLRVKPNI